MATIDMQLGLEKTLLGLGRDGSPYSLNQGYAPRSYHLRKGLSRGGKKR